MPKKWQIVPAPLVAVVLVMLGAMLFQLPIKYVSVSSSLFAETQWPTLSVLGSLLIWSVIISALALCFIASAETLLCATAGDRMPDLTSKEKKKSWASCPPARG